VCHLRKLADAKLQLTTPHETTRMYLCSKGIQNRKKASASAAGTSEQYPSRKQVNATSNAVMTAVASPRALTCKRCRCIGDHDGLRTSRSPRQLANDICVKLTNLALPYSRLSLDQKFGPKARAASSPTSTLRSELPFSSAPGTPRSAISRTVVGARRAPESVDTGRPGNLDHHCRSDRSSGARARARSCVTTSNW